MSGDTTFDQHLSDNRTDAAERERILADPGFGKYFTDHMATAVWSQDQGWHDATIQPYGPLSLSPATAVLHYAQEIFEGLKCYRHEDGSIWAFRPEANAARMQRSAARMALPQVSEQMFLDSITELVAADKDWVPSGGETSLYLRPFMFASEAFLGVKPAAEVTYCVIASPAGSYFPGGVHPVSIWLSEEYNRAGPGGTGAAKCGGNYASSLIAQAEGAEHGCEQVVFLDGAQGRWVEELGGMNVYFVLDDGTIVTPELSGSILEGVTRDSILKLAADLGHGCEERRVSIDEWRDGAASGRITEVFACGTAAVITPIKELKWRGGEVTIGDGGSGKLTMELRETLLDIQYGRRPDPQGWMTRLV